MQLSNTTGLFFGSFNPIHIGHMALANYMVTYTNIQDLWFVVSPQNPLKQKHTLLPDYQRLEMVNIAIEDDIRFRASDIEFHLPKPSYTIDTLAYLEEKYPKRKFIIIMGADTLHTLHKWKNIDVLTDKFEIMVYPRPGYTAENFRLKAKYTLTEAPKIEISATFIRKAIKEGKDIRHFLPHRVYEHIHTMGFYC